MVNTRINAELRASQQFFNVTKEIQWAMENSGKLTAPSVHHDLAIPAPPEEAPAGVAGLSVTIRDKGDEHSRTSLFTISALGESAANMEHFDGLTRPNSIIQTRMPDGTPYFTQLLTKTTLGLLTQDDDTFVKEYQVHDFAGAKEAGLVSPDTEDPTKNPVYQLLLQVCHAPASLSVADIAAGLRTRAIEIGASSLRQSGRFERSRRGFIMYDLKKQLFPEDTPDKPDVVRQTYSTTTFAPRNGRKRIDTKLTVRTLLNPESLNEPPDIISMTGIAVRRTVLDLWGDYSTTHERPVNSEQAMDFVRPLFAVVAPTQSPIRYNRQKAA